MKCVLFQNRERTKGSHKKFSIDFDDIYQRIAVNSNLPVQNRNTYPKRIHKTVTKKLFFIYLIKLKD